MTTIATPITTPVTIPIKHLQLSPGSVVTISDVTWEQYEAILEEWGEHRRARIAYCDGILEIVSPLPIHECSNRIIADIVKVFLDAEDREWEDFGSTTFKRPKKSAGLEPDTCFYIDENAQRLRDCLISMDLEVYPPADLAIEADVTSKTTLKIYARIGVPEVWIYNNGKLTIHLLENGQYRQSESSLVFADRPITTQIPQLVQQALQIGTSKLLKQLRSNRSQGT